MSGLRLQQEEQVSVFLCLVVVGEGALLDVGCVFEVASDFVLL